MCPFDGLSRPVGRNYSTAIVGILSPQSQFIKRVPGAKISSFQGINNILMSLFSAGRHASDITRMQQRRIVSSVYNSSGNCWMNTTSSASVKHPESQRIEIGGNVRCGSARSGRGRHEKAPRQNHPLLFCEKVQFLSCLRGRNPQSRSQTGSS